MTHTKPKFKHKYSKKFTWTEISFLRRQLKFEEISLLVLTLQSNVKTKRWHWLVYFPMHTIFLVYKFDLFSFQITEAKRKYVPTNNVKRNIWGLGVVLNRKLSIFKFARNWCSAVPNAQAKFSSSSYRLIIFRVSFVYHFIKDLERIF